MKNLLKIAGVFALALVYSYSISISFDTSSKLRFNQQKNSNKEFYFSSFASNLISQTAQTKSSVYNYFNFPVSCLKNHINCFGSLAKIIDQIFVNNFVNYNFISRNFLYQFWKYFIIFPFHYFW
ncbi:MAG: hypothetical protein KA792_06675 [Bacteroidales bacterium]|nr:hypothetical protein [Bacteroidales bacterium]